MNVGKEVEKHDVYQAHRPPRSCTCGVGEQSSVNALGLGSSECQTKACGLCQQAVGELVTEMKKWHDTALCWGTRPRWARLGKEEGPMQQIL